MIYVVGTGRCGTMTLARLLGGVHEPSPPIIAEATDYYLGRHGCLGALVAKLRVRASLKTPAISDNKQSTVIPVIREVDPRAEFIMLVREPIGCVASFVRRGTYRRRVDVWERHRLRPLTGFPRDWTQSMKCGWLWAETNRVVLSSLGAGPSRIMFTDELGSTVLNASPGRRGLRLNGREREFFRQSVLPLWAEINARAGRLPPGTIRAGVPGVSLRRNVDPLPLPGT
jgi:hypothetical protein